MRRRTSLVGVAVLVVALAGCSSDTTSDATSTTRPTTSAPTSEATSEPADDDLGLSEPLEDSVYPDVGDPGVDALHYDLGLAWDPDTDTLTGTETLSFRATTTADDFQLDLGAPLEITALTVDGADATYDRTGKDLVVAAPVEADQRYELVLSYAGTPEPVEAPTTRPDVESLGFTIDDAHQVWTMQEPFGAYTWYAVNDQPSDKALYDFTLSVPSPWTGIANGTQTSSDDDGTTTTTAYHLADPAASYLVTLAFGDYDRTDDTGPNDEQVTYWTPRGDDSYDANLSYTPDAIAWLEQYLGPYPFASAGVVIVDSESAMETQTMMTFGNTDYATSRSTVVHELAHQWYGDQVTPNDWRDVWMNEGMAMYLQLMWEADQEGTDLDDYLVPYKSYEIELRASAGPFGAFDPTEFGSSNVYYGPAFMWHALRERLGDDEFFAVVRSWPEAQAGTSTDRETFLAYLESETGEDLDDFWDAWLLGETSPLQAD